MRGLNYRGIPVRGFKSVITSNSPQEIKNQGIIYFVDPEYKV